MKNRVFLIVVFPSLFFVVILFDSGNQFAVPLFSWHSFPWTLSFHFELHSLVVVLKNTQHSLLFTFEMIHSQSNCVHEMKKIRLSIEWGSKRDLRLFYTQNSILIQMHLRWLCNGHVCCLEAPSFLFLSLGKFLWSFFEGIQIFLQVPCLLIFLSMF